ncbi:hypothetical protein PR202_ga19531 [Eleusine coracana subsp. coracana]|uniref:Uncharacterized protein n=1 Tax=Eleusine coracana subsp. coracana TaxID=191504 RepID=A0AAV5CW02_ELECO|nr:hypothetical protein PR202_ga19531 [Eleusine coracana subsp. coracana]
MPALRSPFAGGDLPAGDVDPDYLYFLQHVRLDGDSYALELPARGASPPTFIKYEAPPASSDGECVSDPSPGRLSTNRREEEKGSSASVEAEPAWHGSLGEVDEDYRIFLQHTRLVDGQLVLEIGGAVINYDQPDASRFGDSGDAEKEKGKRRGQEVASPGEMFSVGGEREGVAVGTPETPVPEPYACDWQADPTPGQENEGLLNAGTLKGVYWEASSSSGRVAGLPAGAEGKVEKEPGTIWPAHINLRPDSDFKRRLIQDLTKPASRKEYYKLFDMATLRTPLMKLRQVRNETKFYPTEEMGSSYLDHYPDLAEQIMKTGSRHGLALMRGFFFWLQNNAHEDQFKPWVDDSKGPEHDDAGEKSRTGTPGGLGQEEHGCIGETATSGREDKHTTLRPAHGKIARTWLAGREEKRRDDARASTSVRKLKRSRPALRRES